MSHDGDLRNQLEDGLAVLFIKNNLANGDSTVVLLQS